MKVSIQAALCSFAFMLSLSASAGTLAAEVDSILAESEADYAEDLPASEAAELVAIERGQIQAMVSETKADRATVRTFLSDYRASKKEYRAWKRENRAEAKAFLKSVARLRKEMRRDPGKFQELATMREDCGDSARCAAERMTAVLEKNVEAGEKARTVTCSLGDRDTTFSSWHLVLYGQSYCDADWSHAVSDAKIRTIGLGLYGAQVESNVYFCTGDTTNKTVVGPYAQAAFGYFGTRLGFLFGGAGACVNFNYSFGFGASAGLQIVTFER